MAQPIFSLAYTSVRAGQIPVVVDMWRKAASGKYPIEVVISVDGNRPDCLAAARSIPDASVAVQPDAPFNSTRGWNMAAQHTTGKVIICVADDFKPCQDWDEKLFTLKTGWVDEDWVAHTEDGYVHDLCVLSILTRKRYDRFGYVFYPKYPSIFCLEPNAKIWMGDLTFKPICQITPNDAVIGTCRKFGPSGSGSEQRNFLSRSRVRTVLSRQAEILEIGLASGRKLRSTADHLWAYRGDGRLAGSTAKVPKLAIKNGPILIENGFLYGIPLIGRKLLHVIDPTPSEQIDETTARELGWLAGIMDGEGCFPTISQSLTQNPSICSEIERLLKKHGFPFTISSSHSRAYGKKSGKTHQQHIFTLVGGRDAYVRFLNKVRPLKKESEQAHDRILTARFTNDDKIVSIEPIGIGPVMCLKTETGNYVADGYLSHNSDTEFTEVAYAEGRVIVAKHILMEHMHPDCRKRSRDNFDIVHASKDRWNQGELLFKFRKAQGFPVDDGPRAVNAKAPAVAAPQDPYASYAMYMQANRDDLCLSEVCDRLFDEGIRNFFFCIPDEYWSTKPTPRAEVDQVVAVAKRLKEKGANAIAKLFCVSNFRFPGESRITVETRVRNDAISWVRQHGFKNICVVDSDELWARGTLAKIKEIVDSSGPLAISLPMIPVMGFPGYPIQGATDRVISYVGQSCVLRDCRTPIGQVYYENRTVVYHFTSTRRTKEETIEKHRQSGHFDDPDYDFENWIVNVLPNTKPGMKNAHMYKRYQIWPEVRAWTPQDLAEIPQSIHPYLAVNG